MTTATVFRATHVLISKGRRTPVAFGTQTNTVIELVGAKGATGFYWFPHTGSVRKFDEANSRKKPVDCPGYRVLALPEGAGTTGGARPASVGAHTPAGLASRGMRKISLVTEAKVPAALARLSVTPSRHWAPGAAPSVIVTKLVALGCRHHGVNFASLGPAEIPPEALGLKKRRGLRVVP